MGVDSIEEPDYVLKSPKARKISHIISESLISHLRLSFLVFGPGKRSEEFQSHRVPVKKLIGEELKQTAAFPEEIPMTPGDDPIEKALLGNTAAWELFLMKKYDYTVILLMSEGSTSEYSLYLSKPEVAHKIRLYIPARRRNSQSYLVSGPVKAFEDVYRQVYYFDDPKHLLEVIKDMVIKMLVMRSLQS
jgi:hypothetical protein